MRSRSRTSRRDAERRERRLAAGRADDHALAHRRGREHEVERASSPAATCTARGAAQLEPGRVDRGRVVAGREPARAEASRRGRWSRAPAPPGPAAHRDVRAGRAPSLVRTEPSHDARQRASAALAWLGRPPPVRPGAGTDEQRRQETERGKVETTHGVELLLARSLRTTARCQGRFPGSRVIASLPTFPGSRGSRVAAPSAPEGSGLAGYSGGDRAGFRPASLLPSRDGRHPDVAAAV